LGSASRGADRRSVVGIHFWSTGWLSRDLDDGYGETFPVRGAASWIIQQSSHEREIT